jgi:hypothetical protein
MCTIFYVAPTYFGAITHHLQGADTKISLKHTAIKYVTINIHMLWYQKHRIFQVWAKIIYLNVIPCWQHSNHMELFLKWLKMLHVYGVINLCVQTSILPRSKWIPSLYSVYCMVGAGRL